MSLKVRIVKPFLRPMGSDEALNRIAVVYEGQEEYRVSAPAKAEGPAIEWLDHASVRQPDPTTFGSEIEVSGEVAKHIIQHVREELERQPASAPAEAKAAPARAAPAFDPIQLLCSRFHEVVKQIRGRHAGRNTLDVADEYDVQDLMHALLRLFFDDIRDEEWTPSYAGGAARMDFLLPEAMAVLEMKMARKGLGAKEIGEQLIIDIAKYGEHPKCKRLICLVYDPSGFVANPRGIERDLSKKHGELDVEVFIIPR
jgi:hypothetical protein